MSTSVRKLDGAPGTPGLYARAALGALPGAALLPFVGGRGDRLPDLELRLDGVELDRDHLASYCRVCSFTLRDTLPATYPHVLSFPLQMRLMADGGFPFPLLGLVHLDNEITQHRPIRTSESLDLAVRADDLRAHPKGRAFSLIGEARSGGELVWEERGTILRRGSGDADASWGDGPAPVPDDAPAVTEWRLDGDLGRRYGAASGDRNPIHMHALSARALGFPRAIAHGMWTKARCLAQLESKTPGAFTVTARFQKPVLLPGRVRLAVDDRSGQAGRGPIAFAVRDARKGTPHLEGSLEAAG
jgi:acyl dehydratase